MCSQLVYDDFKMEIDLLWTENAITVLTGETEEDESLGEYDWHDEILMNFEDEIGKHFSKISSELNK